jgi:hypothetical protein
MGKEAAGGGTDGAELVKAHGMGVAMTAIFIGQFLAQTHPAMAGPNVTWLLQRARWRGAGC